MLARTIAVAVGLLPAITFAPAAEARTFSCISIDGAFRPAGETTLVPAGHRDPTVIGRVFMVEASRPGVVGSPLFRTEGKRVEVLKDSDHDFEILWRNDHQDLTTLKLRRLEGTWTFSYYNAWLGLLLAGRCKQE